MQAEASHRTWISATVSSACRYPGLPARWKNTTIGHACANHVASCGSDSVGVRDAKVASCAVRSDSVTQKGTWRRVHAHGLGVHESPESAAKDTESTHLVPDADDALLYDAQRDALIGFDDSDRGVSPREIRTMARRWRVRGVIIDVDETATSGHAFAYPSLRLLRFHPTALVLWIAAHEVTHLALGPRCPQEPAHGAAFVEQFLTILRVECGADAVGRLSEALANHKAFQAVNGAAAGAATVGL